MNQEGFKRKLTAILSADVEGCGRLRADDDVATVRTLTAYREVMTTYIQQHNGKVGGEKDWSIMSVSSSKVTASKSFMRFAPPPPVLSTDQGPEAWS